MEAAETDNTQDSDSQLPITHEVVMKDHTKVSARTEYRARATQTDRPTTDLSLVEQSVSALSIDPAGSRVVSGSYDYDCKLWDFAGMKADFRPFRSWECKEGHQVSDRS